MSSPKAASTLFLTLNTVLLTSIPPMRTGAAGVPGSICAPAIVRNNTRSERRPSKLGNLRRPARV